MINTMKQPHSLVSINKIKGINDAPIILNIVRELGILIITIVTYLVVCIKKVINLLC